MDPLSDKYPGASPYVYCAGNPVRLVDVDGRDIYEFDKKGNLINRIENKEADIIRVVNRRGKEISSKSYKYGTILKAESNDISSDKTVLSIKDNASRTSIFEQLAYNTKVEWMTINANKGDEEINYISTSKSNGRGQSSLPHLLYVDGYTAIECSHSHPKNLFGSNCPSGYGFLGDQVEGGDRVLFCTLNQMWPGIDVKVLDVNNGHYYQLGFSKNDIIDIDRDGNKKPYSPY